MSDLDARPIVARLHKIRARREPTLLRRQQDAAALRKDLAVLVTAATALQQEAPTDTVRRLLRTAVRTATSVLTMPDPGNEQETVQRFAAATAKLLRAVTRRPVPPQSVSPGDRLAEILRRRIANGRYLSGSKLPTRSRLMADDKASAGTVSEAVRQLKPQGLLVTIRGSGTWLAPAAQTRLTSAGRPLQGGAGERPGQGPQAPGRRSRHLLLHRLHPPHQHEPAAPHASARRLPQPGSQSAGVLPWRLTCRCVTVPSFLPTPPRTLAVCMHTPPCPPAESVDREATAIAVACPEQGWTRGCNGLYFFEDTGLLLPDGQVIAPHGPLPERVGASL